MDFRLWKLCQRDDLLGLRDLARHRARGGDIQARCLMVWLDQALATRSSDAGALPLLQLDASSTRTAPLPPLPASAEAKAITSAR